jgi:integrase
MDVIKSVLNRAKLDLLYIEKYNYFKKIDYKIIGFDNSALPKEIVQKLLEIEHDKNIYELRMFLIAIFLHGIRISDLLLLKNEDFKKDKIFYVSKKSKKNMTVRYDDKLVTLLSKILSIPLVEDTHSLNVEIDKILAFEDGNLKNVDITKEYTERQNNKNKFYGGYTTINCTYNHLKGYFFKKIMDREPLLGKYDKRKDMTEVQKKAYTRLVVHYNSILGKIAEKYDIEKMTSHTSRYTFANLSLGVPTPDINAISNALGHASVKTTIDYFNKNFGKASRKKVGKNSILLYDVNLYHFLNCVI